MVIANNVKKYRSSIGQKTGILNASKNVQNRAINVALVDACLKT